MWCLFFLFFMLLSEQYFQFHKHSMKMCLLMKKSFFLFPGKNDFNCQWHSFWKRNCSQNCDSLVCWYLVAQWSLIIQIFHRVKRTQDHQTNISYGSIPAFWDKTINLISRHLNLFTAIHKAVTTSTDQVHTEHTESFSWFLLLKCSSRKGHKNLKWAPSLFWRDFIISKNVGDFLQICGILTISELYYS